MNTSSERFVIPCRSRALNIGAWCVLIGAVVFWALVAAALIWWLR